jgi:hypothetical protein
MRPGLGISYDRQNQVVILVGAAPTASHIDTWLYDPVRNTWTDLKPTVSPRTGGPNKDCQLLAYDEEHNVHLLGLVDHGPDDGVWAFRYQR